MPTLLSVWWFGIEVSRFPSADDGVDAAAGALDAPSSGSTTSLAPYRGPALQPTLAYQHKALEIGLAPALHRSADPEADLQARQYRAELRPRWRGEIGFVGLDLGVSGGKATREGDVVAQSPSVWSVAPSLGARAPLGDHLALSGRALWRIEVSHGTSTQGLSGAASLEWRR